MRTVTSAALRDEIYAAALALPSDGKKSIIVKDRIVSDLFLGLDTRKVSYAKSITFKNCVFMRSANINRLPRDFSLSIVNCTFKHSLSLMGMMDENFTVKSVTCGNMFDVRHFKSLSFEGITAKDIIIDFTLSTRHVIELSIGDFLANSISINVDDWITSGSVKLMKFEVTACHERVLSTVHSMLPTVNIRKVYTDKEKNL